MALPNTYVAFFADIRSKVNCSSLSSSSAKGARTERTHSSSPEKELRRRPWKGDRGGRESFTLQNCTSCRSAARRSHWRTPVVSTRTACSEEVGPAPRHNGLQVLQVFHRVPPCYKCYSMLQRVTTCYSMLQRVTTCYTALRCVTLTLCYKCHSVLQRVTACYNMLHRVTLCYTVLHRVSPCHIVSRRVITRVTPRYTVSLHLPVRAHLGGEFYHRQNFWR
eukprot:3593820-Pyramimonas_sp.AAC.1